MKKSKIVTILLIVVFIVAAVIGFIFLNNRNNNLEQKDKLVAELKTIDDLMNAEQLDLEKVRAKLDETTITGDYAVVEKAAKAYYKDSLDSFSKMMDIIEDEKLQTILTSANYKEDGPEFKETRAYIEKLEADLLAEKNIFVEFLKEEKIMSYIEKENVKDEQKEFYKELLVSNLNYEEESKEIDEAIAVITKILDGAEKVFDFLEKNKKDWSIEGEQIVFTSDKLLNEYNNLLTNYL